MFVAMMESESRSWVALGKTENQAKNAILTEWNEFQRRLGNHGFDNNWCESVEALEEDYEITVVRLNAGECVHW